MQSGDSVYIIAAFFAFDALVDSDVCGHWSCRVFGLSSTAGVTRYIYTVCAEAAVSVCV